VLQAYRLVLAPDADGLHFLKPATCLFHPFVRLELIARGHQAFCPVLLEYGDDLLLLPCVLVNVGQSGSLHRISSVACLGADGEDKVRPRAAPSSAGGPLVVTDIRLLSGRILSSLNVCRGPVSAGLFTLPFQVLAEKLRQFLTHQGAFVGRPVGIVPGTLDDYQLFGYTCRFLRLVQDIRLR
jgi:hypothetical protein